MSSGPPKFVYSTSTNCRKTLVSAKPHISRITDSLELPETTFESQVIRLFSCNRLRISQMIRCVWCITESSNPPPINQSLGSDMPWKMTISSHNIHNIRIHLYNDFLWLPSWYSCELLREKIYRKRAISNILNYWLYHYINSN